MADKTYYVNDDGEPALYLHGGDEGPPMGAEEIVELLGTLHARVAELEATLTGSFNSGVHHGHTQAVEQVRDHCSIYHGWSIHKKLEPLLESLRRRAIGND